MRPMYISLLMFRIRGIRNAAWNWQAMFFSKTETQLSSVLAKRSAACSTCAWILLAANSSNQKRFYDAVFSQNNEDLNIVYCALPVRPGFMISGAVCWSIGLSSLFNACKCALQNRINNGLSTPHTFQILAHHGSEPSWLPLRSLGSKEITKFTFEWQTTAGGS